MATQLTPQNTITVTPTANAADATGNYVVPGTDRVAIRINNASGVSVNVTFDDVVTAVPDGGAATLGNFDVILAVPAGASRYFLLSGDRKERFVNPTNGRVSWTYSAATSVTVEVVAV